MATTLGHNQVTQNLDIISIAPNPTNEIAQMIFNHNKAEGATVTIYDTFGKIVYSSSIQLLIGINKFSLPSIAKSGMYCVQVNGINGVWNERLIVK